MLFNSFEFVIFFPVVTLLYFLLPHKFRWLHLLIASCVFYCAFIPVYILILILTIIIDYFAGIMIENAEGRRRKAFLILSLIANIGVLAVFKYYDFFVDNMNMLLQGLHITAHQIPFLKIILPVGLSFHTFQAMSYTIEVYRGNLPAERHFGIYSLYVMFYPQLVAGPIERPQNLLHQFREKHYFESNRVMDGLRLMLWGFFKKVVIADRLALYVNHIYDSPTDFNAINLSLATVFFAIQIYCDFSGYSDIAIGAARVMGFELMTNFKRPYFSKNIQEFWGRWHISLSTWFRDYLYISLGGNRVSTFRRYMNVSIVFLVSGFWHGASWTFIAWGGLHTVYIVSYMLYKEFSRIKLPKNPVVSLVGMVVTFALVCFAWIFFRAENMQQGMLIAGHILMFDYHVATQVFMKVDGEFYGALWYALVVVLLGILFTTEWFVDTDMRRIGNSFRFDLVFGVVIMILIVTMGVFNKSSFIYFQF